MHYLFNESMPLSTRRIGLKIMNFIKREWINHSQFNQETHMAETKSILSMLRVDDEETESSVRLVAPPKIRKPGPGEYIQVHPNGSCTVSALIDVQGPGFYFVAPNASGGIENDLRRVRIHTCINREGEVFFLPQKVGKSGTSNAWNDSLSLAIEAAKKSWIRIKSGEGSYEVTAAKGDLDGPDWSEVEKNMEELLNVAIKPFFIEDSNHIVLKKLRGEI